MPGYPEVFVVGDMIDLDHLPGVAQVAIQGAKYAAKTIDGRLKGRPPQQPFKYFDKGSMATISRFRAVAMVGRLRLTGFVAWLMWLAVHLFYITRLQDSGDNGPALARLVPGRGRSERTATEQQIFGRTALQRLEHSASDLVSPPRPRAAAPRRERRAELEAAAIEEAPAAADTGERKSQTLGQTGRNLAAATRSRGVLPSCLATASAPSGAGSSGPRHGRSPSPENVRLGVGLDAVDADRSSPRPADPGGVPWR